MRQDNEHFSDLVGKTIKAIKHLTAEEVEEMCWFTVPEATTVLILDDGSEWVLSSDEEGNDPGWLLFWGEPSSRVQLFDRMELS